VHLDIKTCEQEGVVKGIHNVIVYKQLVEVIESIGAHEPYLVNLEGYSDGISMKDLTTPVIRPRLVQQKFTIVHQYDRYFDLQNVLLKKVKV